MFDRQEQTDRHSHTDTNTGPHETGGHQGEHQQDGWRRKLCLLDGRAAKETGGRSTGDWRTPRYTSAGVVETGGRSSACRLDKQPMKLKDPKLQFSRRGGGGSSACRMEDHHKILKDIDAHFCRRGEGGSSAAVTAVLRQCES